jgi:DNA-binding CsgD family transcriptional regulator
LTRWGATPDADLVYRTLLTLGRTGASELARSLGMTRRRVETALAELRVLQAVTDRPADSRGQLSWSPAPPDRVVADLRQRRYRSVLSANGSRGTAQSAYGVLADVGVTELGPGLRHLPNRAAARERMATLVASAREDHLSMNPEPVFDTEATAAAAPMDQALIDRGIDVRVLGAHADDGACGPDPCGLAYRWTSRVPMKLIVIDHRVAVFPVDPRNYERGYLEITHVPVVQSLVGVFEQTWATAWDPGERLMPEISLSEREQALIALLVAGHTDATAARELRVSERSISTIMRSLMDRFGVDNRFQLGIALGTLRAAPYPPGLPRHPTA